MFLNHCEYFYKIINIIIITTSTYILYIINKNKK